MTFQQPLMIVDPTPSTPFPPCYPSHDRKYTQLLDFAYSIYSSFFTYFITSIHNLSEPYSFIEVILDLFWQQAMAQELTALHKIDTQDLVPPPPRKCATKSRQVYKIKTKFDESIERHKACLVAKGFSQQYDMDYEETFALVVKMTIIRTLIVVAFVHQ